MKVLHVIDSLAASGGAEHGMVREISRFDPAIRQEVVRLFAADTLDAALTDSGISVIGLGLDSSRGAWAWPTAVSRLGKLVAESKPDVLHSSLFASNVVAQVVARRQEIPILSTFTLSGDPTLLKTFQPGAGSRRASVLRRAAGVAARSDQVYFRALTEDALVTNCRLLGVDQSRAEMIPRGIPADIAPTVVKSRKELGLPADVPILLNVGRQTAQKGHVGLIEAVRRIRESEPAHLVILGRRGDTTPQLEEAITTSGLSDHVTVVEYTPDVAHYLAHATVFVFPSFMEGLGTAVIEALVMGTPVVAFDIPPVREATGNGEFGRLVPVGDIDGLVGETLAMIGTTPQDTEAAREWARETYSIESVSRRVESLLGRVASRS